MENLNLHVDIFFVLYLGEKNFFRSFISFFRSFISSLRGDRFVPPLGFFRSNAGGIFLSHEYGTTIPSYSPYYKGLPSPRNPR